MKVAGPEGQNLPVICLEILIMYFNDAACIGVFITSEFTCSHPTQLDNTIKVLKETL